MSGVLFFTRQDEIRMKQFEQDIKNFIKLKGGTRLTQPAIREVKCYQLAVDEEFFEEFKAYLKAVDIDFIAFCELHQVIKKLPFFKRIVESEIIKVSKENHFLLEFPTTADDWIENQEKYQRFFKIWQKEMEKRKDPTIPVAPSFKTVSDKSKSLLLKLKYFIKRIFKR